jgi:hypothetical protein
VNDEQAFNCLKDLSKYIYKEYKEENNKEENDNFVVSRITSSKNPKKGPVASKSTRTL